MEFSRIKSLNPRAVCAIATLEDAGMPLRLLEENRLLGSDFIVDCRVPSHWEKFLSKIIESKNTCFTEDKLLGLIDYKHRS